MSAYFEFIFLDVLVFIFSLLNFVEVCVTFWSTVFKDYSFSMRNKAVCFRNEVHRFEYFLWKLKYFWKCCLYYSGTTVDQRLYITSRNPINSYSYLCADLKTFLSNGSVSSQYTRCFKYDRDWFVCKQAALRSSCATLREWSHNLHPPSCSG